MSEFDRQEKALLSIFTALEESIDKLTIVGGWLPYLYARYLWHIEIPVIPSTTDVDIGVTETGPTRYPVTVYDRLKHAGLAVERIYADEVEPIEFVYRGRQIEFKVEFITSFSTSDDTLNRFLGKQLACNRIDAFEILLSSLISLPIKKAGKSFHLLVPSPEAFMFHKGITFDSRSNDFKRHKDLFYVYFILKFVPNRSEHIEKLHHFRNNEYFPLFQENIKSHLGDVSKPGYLWLRPFLRRLMREEQMNTDIEQTFRPLFEFLSQTTKN